MPSDVFASLTPKFGPSIVKWIGVPDGLDTFSRFAVNPTDDPVPGLADPDDSSSVISGSLELVPAQAAPDESLRI